MIKHSLALLLLAASLAACARESNPAPAANPQAATTAPASSSGNTSSAAASSSGPKSAGDLAAAAVTQQEGADLAAKDRDDNGQTQLERIAALPAEGQLPASKWVPGTQYKIVSPSQPTDVPPGKVEVMEFFWYGCPHCYALEPALNGWLKNKANYIEFVRVPATWGEVQRAHARLFYTLKALGKGDELHAKVFDTIHLDHQYLYAPNDPLETQREQLKFAKDNGISEADFTKAFTAFSTQAALSQADDLNRRYRIDAVPTFVIAGKYETDMQAAGGESNLFELINDLAASEKHH
ncbi:MAG: thiol:disulfide interchange protein DsbA/DsbL [Steroidobacteraceae bacterium]